MGHNRNSSGNLLLDFIASSSDDNNDHDEISVIDSYANHKSTTKSVRPTKRRKTFKRKGRGKGGKKKVNRGSDGKHSNVMSVRAPKRKQQGQLRDIQVNHDEGIITNDSTVFTSSSSSDESS